MTTFPRQRACLRISIVLMGASLLGLACGKVGDTGKDAVPRPDAGADSAPASGGALIGAGGLVGAGGAVGAGGLIGAGGASSPPDASSVPGTCEDLTGTLPTPCPPTLCECLPALADCGARCWVDVACIRQRCAGSTDPHCADRCGDPLVATRDAVRRCVTLAPECGGKGECGDGVVTYPETCDGTNVGGRTCSDLGFTGSSLKCSPTCSLDTSGCSDCGNGVQEIGEDCEGNLLQLTCKELGYVGGTVPCDSTCHFDTSGCNSCGNARLDEGEDCDGDLLAREVTCRRYGFSGGRPACKDCKVDTRTCAVCGNGVIDPGETCDGSTLGGATCANLGFASGTLACDPKICHLDVGLCANAMPRCGDGIAGRGEECDGKDLTGLDCKAFGFDKGTLTCNPATCRFDDTGCAFEQHDECKECRETKCKYQLDQCTADSRCTEGLHCMQSCAGTELLPGQLQACASQCFADDFNGNLPPNSTQAIALVMTLFGCSATKCSSSCIGVSTTAAP